MPMIASWPGRIASGATTDHLSAFWDVLPTLCEIAGAPVPRDVDGLSFAPTLLGRDDEQERHQFLYWEFPSYGGQQAVRLGRWKGIPRNMFDGNLTVELFDLEHDLEENDVADEHPRWSLGSRRSWPRHAPRRRSSASASRCWTAGDLRAVAS